MAEIKTVKVPIAGMDCAECTVHVQRAVSALPGVESAEVYLTSERAVIRLDPTRVGLPDIRKAVESAGYSVTLTTPLEPQSPSVSDFTNRIATLLAIVFGAVLFVIVIGEWLGLFEQLTERVPFLVGLAIVLVSGYPIFRNVIRAALRRQVTSHTLMTFGFLAALAVGQWATAAVVVFFMRVGDYAENFTTERARRAVRDLTALAPQTARVERQGEEVQVRVDQVKVGETVIVRPGDKIPVDGEVLAGHATVDQSTITGEAMPVEVAKGAKVLAATIAKLGSLRVRATHVGADTTFGRVIKLVEEAEAHRAEVQRFADKFTAYYLPIVAGFAALTFLIRRDPLATAAVLVVACSCSIALATPISMLASVGAAAKRGVLIKGGKYLETLARADVLLIDKTGTLTLGRPQLTDIIPLDGYAESDLLALAASAERYSEHPLAEAVRTAARERELRLEEPHAFESVPGMGVRAQIDGKTILVGNRRMIPLEQDAIGRHATELEAQGNTLLFIAVQAERPEPDPNPESESQGERAPQPGVGAGSRGQGRVPGRTGDQLVGILAAADTLRPEVPAALAAVRKLGVRQIELLTGDNERTAAALAERLGIQYRANLLPEDKIAIVKDYQSMGRIVVMVGDGVNDAPALAQANVGIAMGAAGTDIAIEAAHIALMRDDWTLVPQVFQIARRTMGVVKTNLIFAALYNLVGLSLAALGFLPPIFAAAAQSLPDLGILANSSRLLRQK